MLKRFFTISLFFLLLPAASAFAEGAQTGPKTGPQARMTGPITITSETLTSDNKTHTALFEKNVVAKSTDMTIYADKMLVFYKEDGGEVTKIDASGNIKLYKKGRVITSENAIYYAAEDKVVFTGEPRAVDGENVVTGSVMTYFIGEDRSYVEKSKVFLKNNKGK